MESMKWNRIKSNQIKSNQISEIIVRLKAAKKASSTNKNNFSRANQSKKLTGSNKTLIFPVKGAVNLISRQYPFIEWYV